MTEHRSPAGNVTAPPRQSDPAGPVGQLVPLAPRTDSADGEKDRARDYLRRKLAEGRMSPSRKRLFEQELRLLEAA